MTDTRTPRDKPGKARRTEGEGVPSASAVTPDPAAGVDERNRETEPSEKADPQRRHQPKERR